MLLFLQHGLLLHTFSFAAESQTLIAALVVHAFVSSLCIAVLPAMLSSFVLELCGDVFPTVSSVFAVCYPNSSDASSQHAVSHAQHQSLVVHSHE